MNHVVATFEVLLAVCRVFGQRSHCIRCCDITVDMSGVTVEFAGAMLALLFPIPRVAVYSAMPVLVIVSGVGREFSDFCSVVRLLGLAATMNEI
jgi:hypothetical protein